MNYLTGDMVNLFRVAIEANRGFQATIIFLRMVFSRVELWPVFEKHCLRQ